MHNLSRFSGWLNTDRKVKIFDNLDLRLTYKSSSLKINLNYLNFLMVKKNRKVKIFDNLDLRLTNKSSSLKINLNYLNFLMVKKAERLNYLNA